MYFLRVISLSEVERTFPSGSFQAIRSKLLTFIELKTRQKLRFACFVACPWPIPYKFTAHAEIPIFQILNVNVRLHSD